LKAVVTRIPEEEENRLTYISLMLRGRLILTCILIWQQTREQNGRTLTGEEGV